MVNRRVDLKSMTPEKISAVGLKLKARNELRAYKKPVGFKRKYVV
jgi:hypothetical protein